MTHKSFPEREEEVLQYWKENNIFRKSVAARKNGKRFVFFEGPPTANALPATHHVIGRSFKDVIPRFKTMQGYWVWRRAGWDTHGLPVELEVEKALGLSNKKQIEEYGIGKFNQKCRESVWKYKEEWERLTERMGFWIDMEDPYITYEARYIENLWSVFKRFWDKKLLFEDFKVVPYCVRCGTPISSHEVAQGYETVTDVSVYVKFKIKEKSNTYFLAWTTTPWTLPGNVALAVGEEIDYVRAQIGTQSYIVSKNQVGILGEEADIVETYKGSELVGIEYEPLFDVVDISSHEKAHRVYAADFVSTEEGTGIVHTAVMYGADDFELGSALGLPKVHTVSEEGVFVDTVPVVGGRSIVTNKKKDEETEHLIISHLEEKNLLFKKEQYEHEYPFCWRCKSPLLYYARSSWFVGTSHKRKELLANNQKINWIPSYIKDGRFGEWLREVKDWAISRERYWGTPLPIWRCDSETCEHMEVIGSLEELNEKRADKPTTLIFMRHGEALSNMEQLVSSYPELKDNPLTDKGRQEAFSAAQKLKKEGVEAIYASDMQRTKETAVIVATELGLDVTYREDLREIDAGPFNGRAYPEYRHYLEFIEEHHKKEPDRVESHESLRKRLVAAMHEIATAHPGKNVLIISHGGPLYAAQMVLTQVEFDIEVYKHSRLKTGESRKVAMPNWPINNDGEVDLHRPYVDGVRLSCKKCGGVMRRIPELADVWFDSGAMPFAQGSATQEYSKARAGKKKIGEPVEGQFPADYIAEGIDQTRGWFYTLHAVSTLLGRGPSYTNVLTYGHLLDKKGKKMSKSVGNVVDPWEMMNTYGIDTLRWYFYTVNSVGDSTLFDEGGVKERERKFVMTVLNSLTFLETYWDAQAHREKPAPSALDEWVLSRLHTEVRSVTEKLEVYDVVAAARGLSVFVEELSNWYIRRSRPRLQSQSVDAEKAAAQQTLFTVLLTLATLLAPFTPFLAEMVFARLRKLAEQEEESVHLVDWPKADKKKIDTELEAGMETARSLASLALAERAASGIKVRQVLGVLALSEKDRDSVEVLTDIIADEVNMKKVIFDSDIEQGVVQLDTTLTPELEREGIFREVVRAVNSLRKKAGLTPDDSIALFVTVKKPDGADEGFSDRHDELKKDTRADNIAQERSDNLMEEQEWEDRGWTLWVGIKKV